MEELCKKIFHDIIYFEVEKYEKDHCSDSDGPFIICLHQ